MASIKEGYDDTHQWIYCFEGQRSASGWVRTLVPATQRSPSNSTNADPEE